MKSIYDEERKEPTVHQQARTDLLNCYGKYMNKQMYAELWNYTLNVEERAKKKDKLLELYRKLLKYIGLYNASTYCTKETLKDLEQKVKATQKQIDELEEELK